MKFWVSIDFRGAAVLRILPFGVSGQGWMSAEPQRIEVTLETLLESVALAEEIGVRIAEAAGFDEDDRYKIGMAVREGVINAFQYGNEQLRDKKIRLVFELTPEKMVIHVLDQGVGFNLEDVADPLSEENLMKASGRGIFLMKAFMDEFDVRMAQPSGAEVIMAKHYRNAESRTHESHRH